jgi:hypothetical protein
MSPRVILSISPFISIKFFVTWLQACLGPLGKPRYRSNSRRFSLPANRLTTHQLASEPNVSILGKADRERLVQSDGSSAGLTTFSALRNSPAKAGDLVAVLGIGSLKRRSNRLASGRGAKKLGAHHYIDSAATDPAAARSWRLLVALTRQNYFSRWSHNCLQPC